MTRRAAIPAMFAGLIPPFALPVRGQFVPPEQPDPNAIRCTVGHGMSAWMVPGVEGWPDWVALGTPYQQHGNRFVPVTGDVFLKVNP